MTVDFYLLYSIVYCLLTAYCRLQTEDWLIFEIQGIPINSVISRIHSFKLEGFASHLADRPGQFIHAGDFDTIDVGNDKSVLHTCFTEGPARDDLFNQDPAGDLIGVGLTFREGLQFCTKDLSHSGIGCNLILCTRCGSQGGCGCVFFTVSFIRDTDLFSGIV
jgi:hypothetical protein